MIVDKVIDYLDGEGEDVDEAIIRTAKSLIGRTIRRNFGERRFSEPREQSPSSAWACQRRRIFDANPMVEPEPLSARARRTFAFGDVVEAIGIALARQAGVEFASPTESGEQMTIHANHAGVEIVGHLDGHLLGPDHGIIPLDYKSMSDWSFKDAAKAATTSDADWWAKERFGIIAQMRWYLWILRWMLDHDMLPGIEKVADFGLIIAVDKSTGHMAEIRVYQDMRDMQMLLDSFEFVAAAIYSMNEKAIPIEEIMVDVPRPPWTNIVKRRGVELPGGGRGPALEVDTDKKTTQGQGWRCSYCPYTSSCYEGFEVVPLKGKPVWRKAL